MSMQNVFLIIENFNIIAELAFVLTTLYSFKKNDLVSAVPETLGNLIFSRFDF